MAALPLSLLILGASFPVQANPQWIKVVAYDESYICHVDSFVWDSTASILLKPLIDDGYAFAGIKVVNSELSGDTLILETRVDSGYPVTVEKISFSGKFRTRPALLAHLARFQPFLYSPSGIADLAQLLEDSDCDVIDWELLGEDSLAELHFLVDEQVVPNRLNVGVGYSRDAGFVGSADLGFFNLFGGRRKFSLAWFQLARSNLSFAFSARDPYLFRLPFGLEISAAFRSLNENSFHIEASSGVFLVTRLFEVGAGYAYEEDRADTQRISKNLATSRLSTDFLEARLGAGERKAQRSSAYFRASVNGLAVTPLLWGFSFALSPSGAIIASEDTLLSGELIPVGGARSIRGFAEEEFRGKMAVWSRQELRWGPKVFYLYPLFDAGWIDSAGFLAGYGAGIALSTPLGRLELDAALPWGGQWQEAKLHLSLGAEF